MTLIARCLGFSADAFSGVRMALLFGAALLAACADVPPVLYYSLAEPVPAVARDPVQGDSVPLSVEFAPLVLPERLMRPQLVIRRAGTIAPQVDVLEQHRWSSSFESELRDALAAGVAARLGAIDSSRGGRASPQRVVRIAAQVQHFDAQEDRGIDAAIVWTLHRGEGGASRTCRLNSSERADAGIEALALSAQHLSARWADAIADSVRGGPCQQSLNP